MRRCPGDSIEASYIIASNAFMMNKWIGSYLDLGYAKFILLLPPNQCGNLLFGQQLWHSVGEVEDMRRDVAD